MKTRSEKLKWWGVAFLLLNVPALLLKAFVFISHTPLRYDNSLLVSAGALAMLGSVVGFVLLGIRILTTGKGTGEHRQNFD